MKKMPEGTSDTSRIRVEIIATGKAIYPQSWPRELLLWTTANHRIRAFARGLEKRLRWLWW